MFRLITGLKCPGCGISTLIKDLFVFDFKGAFSANPFIFCTTPLILIEIIYSIFRRKINNQRIEKINNVCLIIYCVGIIIFGIVRNIAGF